MVVDSKLLKALLAAAPKRDVRYYLNGVHVTDGRLEVTNGHYLVITRDEKLYKDEHIFTLIGQIPAKSFETSIDFDTLIATHTNVHGLKVGLSIIELIDGKFPDTEKLLKQFSNGASASVGFNPEYIGLPFKLFKSRQVKLLLGSDESMSKLEFKVSSIDQDIEMYVMPISLN